MAGKVGLEPTTNRLTVYCANQLRYSPVIEMSLKWAIMIYTKSFWELSIKALE